MVQPFNNLPQFKDLPQNIAYDYYARFYLKHIATQLLDNVNKKFGYIYQKSSFNYARSNAFYLVRKNFLSAGGFNALPYSEPISKNVYNELTTMSVVGLVHYCIYLNKVYELVKGSRKAIQYEQYTKLADLLMVKYGYRPFYKKDGSFMVRKLPSCIYQDDHNCNKNIYGTNLKEMGTVKECYWGCIPTSDIMCYIVYEVDKQIGDQNQKLKTLDDISTPISLYGYNEQKERKKFNYSDPSEQEI